MLEEERGYEFGPFRLDVLRRRVWRAEQLIPLSSRGFDTLLTLVSCAGRVVDKDELMKRVWPDTFVVDDNITQQISTLRKALGDHSEEPTYILTVPRRGYRFLADVRQVGDPAGVAAHPHPTPDVQPAAPRLWQRLARRKRSLWIAATMVVALILTASALIAVSRRPSAPSRPSAVRFLIAPPDGMTLQSAGVISPDGRWLVYVGADSSGQSMLMLRALADIDAKPIAGTDGASTPFWSPDSQEIAFFGDTALKRVNVIGETSVRTVVEAFPTRGGGRGGGTWGQGGIIVYAPSRLTELYAVPATGGTARAVSALSPRSRETAHQWPQFLPDGRHFLYTALGRRPEDGGIYVASLDSPERTLILQSAVRAVFAPSGYLLFAQEGSLLAQRFDPSTFRLQGSTRVVASIPNQTDVMISAAQNDALTYAGMLNPARELAWFDRQGRRLTTVTSETVLAPALSPDERRVAGEHRGEIWLVELLHGQASRFMLGPDIVTSPVWSPDGNRLAVASRRAIYVRGANDSGRPELVADGMATPPTLYDWSSDGRYILYTARTPETQWDLWILPLAGSHTPAPFLRTPFTEYQARISPDGRWVAYVSDESSTLEVYVDAFPERGHKVQVSSQGGTHPTWRGDGKELFYLTMDKKLVAAELSPGAGFQIGSRHALFQTRIAGIARNHYTASADGQRFLINSPVSYATISPITIVMNWSSLLQ